MTEWRPGSWGSIPSAGGSLYLLTPEQSRRLQDQEDQVALSATSRKIEEDLRRERRAEAEALVLQPEVELALRLAAQMRLTERYAHILIEYALALALQRMPRKTPPAPR